MKARRPVWLSFKVVYDLCYLLGVVAGDGMANGKADGMVGDVVVHVVYEE